MERELRSCLDRSLDGVRFTPELRRAVLARIAAGERPRRPLLRQGVAAALACALLATAALAAGPRLWALIQAHLGERAAYAAQPQVTAADQGFELGAAAALADRELVTVYLTLRDLEGDRLSQGARLDLRAWGQEELAPAGAAGAFSSYDPETGTLALSRTFSRDPDREVLHLSVGEIVPGCQGFYVALHGEALAEAVPEGTLESAVGEDGKRYLLPGQGAVELDWERCPLPEGAQPGIRIASMGYAEDGRLHFRFQVEEWASLLELDLPAFQGEELEQMAVLPDGVDYAFPAGRPSREDLEENDIFFFSGSYSTQGGPVQGSWELEIPLEPVETVELAWTGGTVAAPDGPETAIDGAWISPLSFSVACRGLEGRSLLELGEAPVIQLRDGTQAAVLPGLRAQGEWEDGTAVSVDRLVWQLEVPVDLEQIEHVTFCGVTMDVAAERSKGAS